MVGDESAFDGLRGTISEGYRVTSEVGPLSALTFNRGRSGKRRPWFQKSPARFAAREFTKALRRRGVVVGGAAKVGRDAGGGAEPGGAAVGDARASSPGSPTSRRTTSTPRC